MLKTDIRLVKVEGFVVKVSQSIAIDYARSKSLVVEYNFVMIGSFQLKFITGVCNIVTKYKPDLCTGFGYKSAVSP